MRESVSSFAEELEKLGKPYERRARHGRQWASAAFSEYFQQLGRFVANAITERNHKFFARMAATLQFNRNPEEHKLYSNILGFCAINECGTKESPCERWDLLDHLKKSDHKFDQATPTTFPRGLYDVCKELGVYLTPGTIGRPRKSPPK